MYKTTNVDIKLIEPEYTYQPRCSLMSKSVPQYWSRLGSSKSWTQYQVELSKENVGQIVKESPESSIIAFTDQGWQYAGIYEYFPYRRYLLVTQMDPA